MSTPANSLDVTSSGLVHFNGSHTFSTKTYANFTTFSPTISGSTTAGVGTYTTQFGSYTQIANMVFVQYSITWSAHTGTGNLLITNLPFACNSTTNYNPEGIVNTESIPLPGGANRTSIGSMQPGTTTINVVVAVNNAPNTAVALNATGTVHGTIAYSV